MIRRACVAACLLALVAATAAEARRPLEIGIQDEPVFVRHPTSYGGTAKGRMVGRTAGFKVARRLRARVLKINMIWKLVEPAPGQYDWSYFDRAVDTALAKGMIPQVSLMGQAPGFATADGVAGINDPDPALYGRFVADAAAHFKGRVRRWAIWNEPNWRTSLAPQERAAEIYRRLYEAGYAAIRAVDPGARIFFGELAPMGKLEAAIPPLEFLRDVTCRDRDLMPVRDCAPLVADGFAHHPYTLRWAPEYPGPTSDDVTTGSLDRLSRMLAALARRGALSLPDGRGLPIYLTEYGFHANSRTIVEPQRTRYALRGYRIALRHPRVRQIVWYHVFGPPPSRHRQWDTALFDIDGRPRPLWHALYAWIRRAERDRLLAR